MGGTRKAVHRNILQSEVACVGKCDGGRIRGRVDNHILGLAGTGGDGDRSGVGHTDDGGEIQIGGVDAALDFKHDRTCNTTFFQNRHGTVEREVGRLAVADTVCTFQLEGAALQFRPHGVVRMEVVVLPVGLGNVGGDYVGAVQNIQRSDFHHHGLGLGQAAGPFGRRLGNSVDVPINNAGGQSAVATVAQHNLHVSDGAVGHHRN